MSLDDDDPERPATGQEQPPAGRTPPELRKISDARTLRALAHPVRIALIETLTLGAAPAAATQAAAGRRAERGRPGVTPAAASGMEQPS